MDLDERIAVLDKVRKMAFADKDVNGSFLNAPYRVNVDGEVWLGRILTADRDGDPISQIHLVRPVRTMASEKL